MNRADFEAQFPKRWQVLKWLKYSEIQMKYMVIWLITTICSVFLFSMDIYMWLTLPLNQYIGIMVLTLLISIAILYIDVVIFITVIREHYDKILENEWDKAKPYMTNSSSFESVLSTLGNSWEESVIFNEEEIFESTRSIDV